MRDGLHVHDRVNQIGLRPIGAGPAVDVVLVAILGEDVVVAGAAEERIYAPTAVDRVVASVAEEGVVAFGADAAELEMRSMSCSPTMESEVGGRLLKSRTPSSRISSESSTRGTVAWVVSSKSSPRRDATRRARAA